MQVAGLHRADPSTALDKAVQLCVEDYILYFALVKGANLNKGEFNADFTKAFLRSGGQKHRPAHKRRAMIYAWAFEPVR